MHSRFARWTQWMAVAGASGAVLWLVATTLQWPITGDAALMHYVAMLLDRGQAPYREILDINLPGAYVPDWLVTRLFGGGALPWRLYDLGLLAVSGVAMAALAGRREALAGVWAGSLFAVIHGRDGLYQMGQRDLSATALLLVGVACLTQGMRGGRGVYPAAFGLCAGAAATIKPTLAPFLLLGAYELIAYRGAGRRGKRRALIAAAVWCLPPALCVVWLMRERALGAFWYVMTVLVPYHASLGRRRLGYLLTHCTSPVVVLVIAWVAVLGVRWYARRSEGSGSARGERNLLVAATGLGFVSYLLQHRGYPYHRYPFLAFLLVLMGTDLAKALRERPAAVRVLSAGALLWAGMVLAPVSAWRASRYDWKHREFPETLRSDLQGIAEAGGLASLNGRVQCIDSITGCLDTLYLLGLQQSTGTMYDEFLLHPAGARAVDESRAMFLKGVEREPPTVFIVTAPLFPSGPDDYAKLAAWPEFAEWLYAHYALRVERRPTRAVQGVGRATVPAGYRLYTQRNANPANALH